MLSNQKEQIPLTKRISPKSRVLFIDNDTLLLGLIRRELEGVDEFQFFGEENAESGLKLAKEIEPDIIVLDHISKGMSGEKVLKEIQESLHLENSKVMLLSKKINSESIRRYKQLGVDDFIEKPFQITELLFRLEKLQ